MYADSFDTKRQMTKNLFEMYFLNIKVIRLWIFCCAAAITLARQDSLSSNFGPKLPVLIPLREGKGGGGARPLQLCHTRTPTCVPPLFQLLFDGGFPLPPSHTRTPQKLIDIQLVGFPSASRFQFSSFVGRLRFGFAATRYALICSAANPTTEAIGKSANILPDWLRTVGHATSCWPTPFPLPSTLLGFLFSGLKRFK